MWIPTFLRNAKNAKHPPDWMRFGILLVEVCCHPIQRLRLSATMRAVRDSRAIDDPNQWLSLATEGLNGSLVPIQRRSEIVPLLQLIRSLAPRRVLEIGTLRGGTFFLLSRAAHPHATLITLDLPFGGFGIGYPRWKDPLLQACGWPTQTIELIRGDSHDVQTFQRVRAILGRDELLDLLFIDGDHSYEGVKKDFELYSALVRKGGVIVLHDIAPGHVVAENGVPRYCQEIKQEFCYKEFVEQQDGLFGIGVLQL